MLMIKLTDGLENRSFLMPCKKDINKEFRKCIILTDSKIQNKYRLKFFFLNIDHKYRKQQETF